MDLVNHHLSHTLEALFWPLHHTRNEFKKRVPNRSMSSTSVHPAHFSHQYATKSAAKISPFDAPLCHNQAIVRRAKCNAERDAIEVTLVDRPDEDPALNIHTTNHWKWVFPGISSIRSFVSPINSLRVWMPKENKAHNENLRLYQDSHPNGTLFSEPVPNYT